MVAAAAPLSSRTARRADLATARRLAAAGDTEAARALFARHGISYVPAVDLADGINEPFCACGHRWSRCDRSRKACGKVAS